MARKPSARAKSQNKGKKLPPGYPPPLDFQPVSDFREKVDVTLRRVGKTQRPTVITRNGRPSEVLISPEAYSKFEEDRESIEVMRAVRRGREDMAKGRCIPADEAFARIRARLEKQVAGRQARKSA